MNSILPVAISLSNFGMSEILLILLIVLILFGGRKLPELARGLGKSMREFRKGQQEAGDEKKDEPPPPPSAGR